MYAGLEAGGTKFVCVVGRAPDEIVATHRIEVTDPATTIAGAVAFFEAAVAGGQRLDALGIASFGPVELRPEHPAYGCITVTPKAGWSGADVVGPFRGARHPDRLRHGRQRRGARRGPLGRGARTCGRSCT